MRSHKTFPSHVLIRMARCPMPNFGSVQMEMKRSSASKGLCLLTYFGELDSWRAARVVKLWPVGGINCLAERWGKGQ